MALREILSGALELEPSAIQYELNPQGKPRLGGPAAAAGLHFNLSGTAGLSLVALSWDGPLGVDVERHRDDRSLLDVAERYFSAAEVGSLRALEPAVQLEAFHRIWTRKEAYIKAVGLGLSMELASFDVSHDAGAGARLLATRPDAAAAERWRLADLDVGPRHAAALVATAAAAELRVEHHRWTPASRSTARASGVAR